MGYSEGMGFLAQSVPSFNSSILRIMALAESLSERDYENLRRVYQAGAEELAPGDEAYYLCLGLLSREGGLTSRGIELLLRHR